MKLINLSVLFTLVILICGCASYGPWERDDYYSDDGRRLPETMVVVSRSAQPWFMVVPEQYEWGIQISSGKVIKIESWWK